MKSLDVHRPAQETYFTMIAVSIILTLSPLFCQVKKDLTKYQISLKRQHDVVAFSSVYPIALVNGNFLSETDLVSLQ